MNTQIDLKSTEKASYRLAAHADGTSDIGLGLTFLLLGLYPFTRASLGPGWNMVLFLVILGLITLGQVTLRKRLAPSRIGVVKFGPQVRQRKVVMLLITILLAGAMITTWVLSARGYTVGLPAWLSKYGFEILVAVAVLGIFWGVAYSMHLPRYYIYGVLLAAGFPLQSLIPIYEGTPFLVAGALITTAGIFLLTRFLRQYPPQDAGQES